MALRYPVPCSRSPDGRTHRATSNGFDSTAIGPRCRVALDRSTLSSRRAYSSMSTDSRSSSRSVLASCAGTASCSAQSPIQRIGFAARKMCFAHSPKVRYRGFDPCGRVASASISIIYRPRRIGFVWNNGAISRAPRISRACRSRNTGTCALHLLSWRSDGFRPRAHRPNEFGSTGGRCERLAA